MRCLKQLVVASLLLSACDSSPASVNYDAGPCMNCVGHAVSWVVQGGYDSGVHEVHALSTCRVYSTDRVGEIGNPRCTTTLAGCEAPDGVARLQRLLAHPDVIAAMREERPFYGKNHSGTDSGFLEVHIDDRTFFIGAPCTGASCGPDAREIPAGIAALEAFLNATRSSLQPLCQATSAPDGG